MLKGCNAQTGGSIVHLKDGTTRDVNFPPLSLVWATGHPKDFFAVEPATTNLFFKYCFTYVDGTLVDLLQVDINIKGNGNDDANRSNNAYYNDLNDVAGVRIYIDNVTGVKTQIDTTSSVGDVQSRLPAEVPVTSARIYVPLP